VSNKLDSLSDDEVRQIALLVETLDRSTFDYLQVEVGNLKVTIGKGGVPQNQAGGVGASSAPSAASAKPAQSQAAAPPEGAAAVPASSARAAPARAEKDEEHAGDGTVTVAAPLLGRFYAQPEPGAAPFVSLGAEVTADTTVGLIEVMKVFTAVRAGVSGVVTEICVQDAEFVEYGRALFRVRPAKAPRGADVAPRKRARS